MSEKIVARVIPIPSYAFQWTISGGSSSQIKFRNTLDRVASVETVRAVFFARSTLQAYFFGFDGSSILQKTSKLDFFPSELDFPKVA